MITCRNYAAKVENYIDSAKKSLTFKKIYSQSENLLETLPEAIKRSHNFVLPDYGIILNAGFKGLVDLESVNLPYPIITLEIGNQGILITAMEGDSEIVFFTFQYDDKKRWALTPAIGRFSRIKPFTFKDGEFGIDIERTLIFNDDFENEIFTEHVKQEIKDQALFVCETSGHIILEFIEALSCRNVEEAVCQKASSKNTQRIKSHKLPIYETKFLTLKGAVKEKNATGEQGTGTSPRQHLRRGHIRRLPKGNIWVNSCVVGDASNGVISKQYILK